jgi:hypothetical protein
VFVHQGARPVKLFTRKIGSLAEQRLYPFFVHVCGPSGAKKIRQGQVHEKIPEIGRIQNIRVIERV